MPYPHNTLHAGIICQGEVIFKLGIILQVRIWKNISSYAVYSSIDEAFITRQVSLNCAERMYSPPPLILCSQTQLFLKKGFIALYAYNEKIKANEIMKIPWGK